MSDSARLYAYKALFEAKRLVTRADMMEVAEVSLATFKRDIAKLRDQMGMPILFDKDRGGYFLDRNNLATEMPGLWFSPEELVSLLTIQRLIEQLEPGLVGLKLRPLQKKLTELLKAKGLGEAEIARRVRMTSAGNREMEIKAFEQVALASSSYGADVKRTLAWVGAAAAFSVGIAATMGTSAAPSAAPGKGPSGPSAATVGCAANARHTNWPSQPVLQGDGG
jgi:hypothetical protein